MNQALDVAGKILNKMSVLRVRASDPTKTDKEIEQYNYEFKELQRQLCEMKKSKFKVLPKALCYAQIADSTSKGFLFRPSCCVIFQSSLSHQHSVSSCMALSDFRLLSAT